MERGAHMGDELATLCRSCGLCCDGSLFGHVRLAPDEIAPARRRRLLVIDGGGLTQPCAALRSRETSTGTDHACAVYDERPRACRAFVCRLRERHAREGGPLEPRLDAVRNVRRLVAELQARGLTPADFDDAARTTIHDDDRRRYAELQRTLEHDFARASLEVDDEARPR